MFSVKWIAQNGAHHIYSAHTVSYTPPDEHRLKPTISFYDATDNGFTTLDNGEVYVMNANGKTVANYALENGAFPHGLMPRAA